jgi:putative membrane protein
MIVRPRPSAFGLLFTLRGSILPTIAPRLLIVLGLAAAVTGAHALSPQHFAAVNPAPFTLLGLGLSIFLGFRNSACYDRWWEGRRQWGALVADSRVLAREIVTLLPDDAARRARLGRRVVAFALALRDQLRGTDDGAWRTWLPDAEGRAVAAQGSRPDAILLAESRECAELLRRGEISDNLYRLFSDRLLALTSIQTACERLRSTPAPFTYTLLLHRTAWLFCLLLPFGLVGTLELVTPVATVLLAYAFFGLDALGDELEEPFGHAQNALPLDALVRTIEIAVLQALGETDLPPPLQPRDFVLS